MWRSASSRRADHPAGRHDDDTATPHRFRYMYRQRGRSEHLACFGDVLRHSAHRSAHARRSTPTPSKAGSADWRRHRRLATRSSSTGECWRRVHFVPARPRPLGEHRIEPHGLRFTRTHPLPYRCPAACRAPIFCDSRNSPQICLECERSIFVKLMVLAYLNIQAGFFF